MEASLQLPTDATFVDGNESSPTVNVKWSWQLRAGLVGSLFAAIAAIGLIAIVSARQKSADADSTLVAFRGLNSTVKNHLDAQYSDTNGDLLADPPGPAGLLRPETLVLAHYMGDDEGRPRVDWKGLEAKLELATGRPVDVEAYLHTPDEIKAVADGKVHLVAAHAAEIPSLVNDSGLVPFAELRSPEGTDGNRLVVAVPPRSQVTSLEGLRGKLLVCTEPDSITGYRAAIVAIGLETGMQPNVDYQIYFSHKHERSIRGLAIGKFPFIALSNDVLRRMLDEDRIKKSQVRVIYESEVIPRLTIGHVHQLAPDLVAKVKAAVIEFGNENVEREPGTDPFRFIEADYRNEYDFVRRLDDAFSPRFGQIFQAEFGQF